MAEVRYQTLDVRYQMSDVRCQMSDIRGQRSEDECLRCRGVVERRMALCTLPAAVENVASCSARLPLVR